MEFNVDANLKEIIILITEDNDGHAELIAEGLRESGVMNKIIRFSDGQELWDFISSPQEIERMRTKINYLILLDINMPRMDGVQVLGRIKSNPDLKETPIMMLTTTDDPREVEKCYELGCNVYITKPVDF